MKPLYRTIIHIWTEYDPTSEELEDLIYEAVAGDAYCSYKHIELIANPKAAGLESEFFDDPDEVVTPDKDTVG